LSPKIKKKNQQQSDLGQGIQSLGENLVSKLEFGTLMKQKGSCKLESKLAEDP
jgi:hypothetical protein